MYHKGYARRLYTALKFQNSTNQYISIPVKDIESVPIVVVIASESNKINT